MFVYIGLLDLNFNNLNLKLYTPSGMYKKFFFFLSVQWKLNGAEMPKSAYRFV